MKKLLIVSAAALLSCTAEASPYSALFKAQADAYALGNKIQQEVVDVLPVGAQRTQAEGWRRAAQQLGEAIEKHMNTYPR